MNNKSTRGKRFKKRNRLKNSKSKSKNRSQKRKIMQMARISRISRNRLKKDLTRMELQKRTEGDQGYYKKIERKILSV